MCFIGYCAGCIEVPQLWKSEQKPRYTQGVITDLVAWVLLLFPTSEHWYFCWSSRKRGDALDAKGYVASFEKGADVTDGEDLPFGCNC
ncbi:hypothetical protein V8E51_001341 [Hyaloscypha variabilis]